LANPPAIIVEEVVVDYPVALPEKIVEEAFQSPIELEKFWQWKGRENEGWKVEALKLASEVSGNNLDFIRKITGENGGMDHTLQSRVVKNGIREDSWGYCQIHRQWHSAIVDDPRFFTDKRWQMENCFRLWSGGTKFYAPKTPASEFYLKDIHEI